MTYQNDCTLPAELLEEIALNGVEHIPALIQIMVNEAMRHEREHYLDAHEYERTKARKGYANGYKPKTVTTRVGKIKFEIPQTRDGDFYPESLEKGLRSERALTMTLAEMYVQGVSTRRVAKITERLCGTKISSSQVSRATKQLDTLLEAWRNRPLGKMTYLYLDARYEKVRIAGIVQDAAILIATGVNQEGKRSILGVSVSLSEAEVHWKDFMEGLLLRGLEAVKLVISDAHKGMQKARRETFVGIPWQRCQFHLQQNASQYVPRKHMKSEVAADIKGIFNAPNREMAEEYLKVTILKYEKSAPKLADWLEEAIPEGLTIFSFPAHHRKRIRTGNMLERLNEEVRRRTRVVRVFPNEGAALRLISAVLMEVSEDWETGKIYLQMNSN